MNTDHMLEELGQRFSRAHQVDRGERAAEAEASVAVKEAAGPFE
jgi:hypothetical protein